MYLFKRDPAGSIASCAWPRPPGTKHILLIATGCPSTAGGDKERLAKDLATRAASNILGDDVEHYYLPNGLEDFQDTRKVSSPPLLLCLVFLMGIVDLGFPFLTAPGFEETV